MPIHNPLLFLIKVKKGAEMEKIRLLFLAVILSTGIIGCSHYSSNIPLKENMNTQMHMDIANAGILDHRGVNGSLPVISASASRLLVEATKFPDVSGRLNAEELSLLLSQPVELAIATQQLRNLGQRLGYRYVVVGEQGAYPVTERSTWDVIVVVPTPVVVVAGSIPINTSQKQGVMHATRVLRVIDLEHAQIISESYELLRDHNDEGEFTSGEIAKGLSSMNLAKE